MFNFQRTKRGTSTHLCHTDYKKFALQNWHSRTWKEPQISLYKRMMIIEPLHVERTFYRSKPSLHWTLWVLKTCSVILESKLRLREVSQTRKRKTGDVSVPDHIMSGRLQNKTKMARVEQQCATESFTSTPYLQLSYFTIYLTQGIEILEYYTKVSCWL